MKLSHAIHSCAFFALLTFTRPGLAQSSPTYPGSNQHDQNRALAFAAVAAQASGYAATTWKTLDAFNWCDTPIPISTLPNQTTKAVSETSCWDVMITTHYELFECENGEAFIARSGIGAYNISAAGADIYDWTEGNPCEWISDDPGSSTGSTGASGAGDPTDQNRPLQLKHLIRAAH